MSVYVSSLSANGDGEEMRYSVTVKRAVTMTDWPPLASDLPPDVKAALLAWLQGES